MDESYFSELSASSSSCSGRSVSSSRSGTAGGLRRLNVEIALLRADLGRAASAAVAQEGPGSAVGHRRRFPAAPIASEDFDAGSDRRNRSRTDRPAAGRRCSRSPPLPEEEAAPEPVSPTPPEEAAPSPPPSPQPARRVRASRRRSARGRTVWVGGAACGARRGAAACGYSIEQGYFGPGMRVFLGLVVSAALVGAGEFLRRREALNSLDAIAGDRRRLCPRASLTGGRRSTRRPSAPDLRRSCASRAFIRVATQRPFPVARNRRACGDCRRRLLHVDRRWPGLGLVGRRWRRRSLVSSARPDPWPVVVYLAVVVSARALRAGAAAPLRCRLARRRRCGVALWTLQCSEYADQPISFDERSTPPMAALVVQVLALAGLAFADCRRCRP